MSDKNQFSTFIYNRLQECRINRRAYEIWLSHLNPWNVVTIVSPAVLSVIAGSTILTEPTFLGEDKGRLLAGIFALLSAVLTTIHKVIGCDVHQSECLGVIQAYSSLEVGYERPLDLHDDELKEELLKLDARYEQIKSGVSAKPPDWCLRKASRELSTPNGNPRDV
jgi:hypothetical protein